MQVRTPLSSFCINILSANSLMTDVNGVALEVDVCEWVAGGW